MCSLAARSLVDSVRRVARPLDEEGEALQKLIETAARSRVVLLGEATHGTHEFYALRSHITQRLIAQHGFSVVAVEADWPDALAVNLWARGESAGNELEAVSTFRRFPWWMWRNYETAQLLAWIRSYNSRLLQNAPKVGFFGLDLYSAAPSHSTLDAAVPSDEFFLAEQNARLMRNAEQYFRAVQTGFPSSWNLRDRHMAETLDALLEHHDEYSGRETRAVVWAHNSHVGDARYTQLGAAGELNLGQLVRERHPDQTFLVGFTTYRGTVIAAREWGTRPRIREVRPALPDSYEALLHKSQIPRFILDLRDPRLERLSVPRLERAIGALYIEEAELENHYFYAELNRQFDALIHIDQTRALQSIDLSSTSSTSSEDSAEVDTYV